MKLIKRHIKKFEQFINNTKDQKEQQKDDDLEKNDEKEIKDKKIKDKNELEIKHGPDTDEEDDIFDEIYQYFENQKKKRD